MQPAADVTFEDEDRKERRSEIDIADVNTSNMDMNVIDSSA